MTQQLEDQLRTAFREKAAQLSAVAPPLRLPSLPGDQEPGGWLTPGRRKLVAGLAAAATVAAVAVSVAVVGSASAPPMQPPPEAAANLPPFYVATANSGQGKSVRVVAVVRATGTGAVIGTIPAPRPYTDFAGVTGAADDRTFVLVAANYAGISEPEKFYLLRINPGARHPADRARLTPLSLRLPPGTGVMSMALSPDGTSLAVVAVHGAMTANRIIIYNVRTSASHSWQDRGCTDNCIIGGNLGASGELNTISWTADGRQLGFDQTTGAAGHSQFRLLNVLAPGDDVLADSQPVTLRATPSVLQGAAPQNANWGIALITPDGSGIVIDAANAQTSAQPWPPQTLLRYSVRTGVLRAILGVHPSHPGDYAEQVLWSSPDGSTIVVMGFQSRHSAGLLHAGRYTPIPWSADLVSAAW